MPVEEKWLSTISLEHAGTEHFFYSRIVTENTTEVHNGNSIIDIHTELIHDRGYRGSLLFD